MSRKPKPPHQKMRLIPAQQVRNDALKHPDVRAAYDALEDEYAIMSQLIRARIEAGMTQEQVAERMQTSQSAVARLESGGRIPSTRTLQRYAEATGHRLRIVLERRQPARRKVQIA